MRSFSAHRLLPTFVVASVILGACAGSAPDDPADAPDGPAADAPGAIVVYSGRNENLVGELFVDFTAATGIEVEVRYGDTAELAIQILEEGQRSPADVYFGQDAGALGALEAQERFLRLPDDVLELVDPRYRSREGRWTGVTGRSRNLVINTTLLEPADLPTSVLGLVDPRWQGLVGWAPTNGSFQAFVTAMRLIEGEDVARGWLEGMIANGVVPFRNNTAIVEAVGRGEIAIGLTNNYYLPRFTAEDPNFPALNIYLPGDVGGIVNVAGVGVLSSSTRPTAATELVRFLLSEPVQRAFGARIDAAEFPLRRGVNSELLPPLESLGAPDLDLSRLEDLQGTLALLQEVRAFD
jgi:iron(III) transport system substrate-binding protein